MPQAPAPKSARDTYREGFAEEFPDVDMDDEEAFYSQLSKNRDSRRQIQKDFSDFNNMMYENPNAGYFMNDLLSGKDYNDLTASFLTNFGDVFKNALNNPSKENVKRFADALQKNAKQIKDDEEFLEQWTANDEATQEVLAQYKDEKGLDDAGVEAIKDKIANFVAKFASGIIDREMLDVVEKLDNYDADMANAEKRGVAQGRSQRVRENIRESQGDGIPLMQGGRSNAGASRPKAPSIFEQAKKAR